MKVELTRVGEINQLVHVLRMEGILIETHSIIATDLQFAGPSDGSAQSHIPGHGASPGT